ncbi:MAG: DUF4833 domain-containing protein [Chitinophagaceae bacterium]|nr:MAG: DUF4833 domain-containing protein [Chitinophagaceae bacterium]
MRTLLLFVFLVIAQQSFSQAGYPKPKPNAHHLFYIQHNGNHNSYVYDASFAKPGILNEAEPITIYRELFAEGGAKKELTLAQRTFAYGVKFKKIAKNMFEFSLVSYPNHKLYLKVSRTGVPYVETTVNGKKMFLQRMFLQAKAGSSGFGLQPEYIIFYGKNAAGKVIEEKLIPAG